VGNFSAFGEGRNEVGAQDLAVVIGDFANKLIIRCRRNHW